VPGETPEVSPGAAAEGPSEGRGLRALAGTEFSLAEATGGVRGLVESLAPGLLFVIVYLATRELTPALVAASAITAVAIVARLAQRTPLTQALSGALGVGIGVFWAARSGQAQDYFVVGLWTNAAYLVAFLVSIVIGWPLIGLVVGLLRSEGLSWRRDRALRRRYAAASWLWVALFGVRLVVQVPLYLGADVGWLGTARLAMGVPLWALTLWLTWLLVRTPAVVPDPSRPHPDR